jgi:dihydroflavonol-4-reductase
VIPLRAAYAAAWITERVFRMLGRKDFLVSTDAVFLSNAFQQMDNGKARRELGWSPRPVAETVRDAVAWYAKREDLP